MLNVNLDVDLNVNPVPEEPCAENVEKLDLRQLDLTAVDPNLSTLNGH